MEDKKTNKGGPREGSGPKPKPLEEKKIPLTFHVKAKNKQSIKEKVEPIIKKLDK